MTPSPAITIRLDSWEALRPDATRIRFEVFVDEQRVAAEIELDNWDDRCLHAVAYDAQGRALGTGRLLPDGHIGRMAVRREARGSGLGSQLLEALIAAAWARGHRMLTLHAQCHAQGFYERHGFIVQGEAFEEAGIQHVTMTRHAE